MRRNSPGPGAYNIKSRMGEGSKVVIIGKEKSKEDICAPGPGNYEIADPRKGLCVRIGTEKRLGMSIFLNVTSPGPCAYSSFYKRDSTPKYSFGRSKRDLKASLTNGPGPGRYKVPCKFADAPRYAARNQNNEEFQYV